MPTSNRTSVGVSPTAQVATIIEKVRAATHINDGSLWDHGVDRALDAAAPLFVSLVMSLRLEAAEAVAQAEYESNEAVNRATLDDDDD